MYVYLMVGLKAYSMKIVLGMKHYYVTIVMKFNPFCYGKLEELTERKKSERVKSSNRISSSTHTSF